MDRSKLVKVLGSAWIVLALSIFIVNAYKSIQLAKTTGLGAVAGPSSSTVFVIAAMVMSGVVLLVMRSRTR